LFDSLKKKFNSTIGKITDKVSEEAEEEAKKVETKKSGEIASDNVSKSETQSHDTLKDDSSGKEVSPESTEEIKSVEDDLGQSGKESMDNEDNGASKKSFLSRMMRKSSEENSEENEKELSSAKKSESKPESPQDKTTGEPESEENEKSGIFSFIKEKTITEKNVEDILWELEMSLLESDVALEVAEKIINSIKEDLVGKKIKRSSDVADYTRQALIHAVSKILDVESTNIDSLIKEKKNIGEPLIIMFVGINGTGKTTTIAKVSTYFINKGYTPVIAAADTFRAGAIEQISHHADSIGVKIIKHKKGADPAAVAYDAVSHAKAKGKEVVLVDTAGRMQTNINLMDEMKKIKRVVDPDLIVFVGDSLTGNDVVEQAMKFNDAVGVDGIILTKADADAKGGAALSIGYVISKPILFLGTGQSYEDLIEFKPDWMVEQLI
jgi:fused signal recognition particle receptor